MGAQINYIYGQDRVGFLLSKYGGILISVASLLIYNRYVNDALSTLKAYDKLLFDRLNLVSNGLGLEGEIIAKLSRRKEFILEVPVAFSPRKRTEGKKTRARDGVALIWALIKFRRVKA
jgi:dolichol-phosphate hexosyltransferase